jgi:hypothetical protein
MADKLTGIKEFGRFREIPNTTKLQIIEVTRIYKGWNSILTSLKLILFCRKNYPFECFFVYR